MRSARALALLCLCAGPLGLRGAGVTGGEMLLARPSARAVALGEAYSALGDDPGVLAFNPAGLADLKGPTLAFLHYAQLAGVSLEDLSYAHNLDFGTLAFNLQYRGQPDIANPLATDVPISVWDLVLRLSYAGQPAKLLPDLPGPLAQAKAGVSVKWLSSHLGRYTGDAYAVDLGLKAPLAEGIIGAVSVLNLGTPIKFIEEADPLPMVILGGISRAFEPWAGNRLNLAADLEAPAQSNMRLHFGVEDYLTPAFAVRLGYLLDSDQSLNGMSGGLGIAIDQEGLLFRVDYALKPAYYQGFNSFDMQHMFQVLLTF